LFSNQEKKLGLKKEIPLNKIVYFFSTTPAPKFLAFHKYKIL